VLEYIEHAGLYRSDVPVAAASPPAP